MKHILFIVTAAFALAVAASGCTPAVQTGQKSGQKTAPAASDDHHPPEADAHERYGAGGSGRTFLDTLNRGREIALAAADLPKLEVAHEAPAPVAAPGSGSDNAGGGAAGGGAEVRFRIQIMASSQADMVRREKLKAEAALSRPVFMSSEQSLYKLYVGDFKTRAEAEAALPEVKKGGYGDAWIVSTKKILQD